MIIFSYKGKLYGIQQIDEYDKEEIEYKLFGVDEVREGVMFGVRFIASFTCNYYARFEAAFKVIDGEGTE